MKLLGNYETKRSELRLYKFEYFDGEMHYGLDVYRSPGIFRIPRKTVEFFIKNQYVGYKKFTAIVGENYYGNGGKLKEVEVLHPVKFNHVLKSYLTPKQYALIKETALQFIHLDCSYWLSEELAGVIVGDAETVIRYLKERFQINAKLEDGVLIIDGKLKTGCYWERTDWYSRNAVLTGAITGYKDWFDVHGKITKKWRQNALPR